MKVLISDLDGVIYRNKTVTDKDMSAMQSFYNQGTLVIATGRNYTVFKMAIDRLHIPYHYAILCDGAFIVDDKDQIIQSYQFIKQEVFESLKVFVTDENKHFFGLTFSYEKNQLWLPEIADYSFDELEEMVPTLLNSVCIECLNCSEEETRVFVKALEKIDQEDFEIHHNNNYIDLVARGATKETAILYMQHYRFNKEDNYYAIGDSYNDISMFEVCEESYVVDTANDEVKAEAKYVVSDVSECIDKILAE